MLNDLSDMVGVWAGLGGGEGARGRGGIIQAVQIQPLALRSSAAFRRPEHLECTQCESCTQITGTMASDVFEADRAGVP